MGIYERDYTSERYGTRYSGEPSFMRMGLPRLTPVVRWLLIINAAVFFAQTLFFRWIVSSPADPVPVLEKWFSVYPTSLVRAIQLWRLVSYQFLHGGFSHILFNMLGVFFLGPTLERYWGSGRFLRFYLGCGAAGGLFYMVLVATGFLPPLPMIGASGAVLGMLAACAILFPHFVVFILLFPVPIRVAAAFFGALYLVNVFSRGPNAGGDAAHLAGLAAGAIYVFSQPWREKFKLRTGAGRWQQKMVRRQALKMELDRILEKIQSEGIANLSRKEKKILEQATRAEQSQEKRF